LENARNDIDSLTCANRRLRDDILDKTKELKTIKKRIHAGVCPHCNRHFQNVERHMKTKHNEKKGGSND